VTFGRLEISVAGSALVGDRWMGGGSAIVLLHAGVWDRGCWREVAERLGTYRALPGRANLPCLEAADEVAALISDEVVRNARVARR
jgi:hypothetical protein